MNESRWETSRRSARKKVLITFSAFIGISAIIAILFVNNRDQIEYTPVHDPVVVVKGKTGTISPINDTNYPVPVQEHKASTTELPPPPPTQAAAAPPLPCAAPTPLPAKSVPVEPVSREVVVPAPPEKVGRSPDSLPAKVPVIPKNIASQADRLLQSIQLPSIRCGVDSRKDVVISLSLELFFEDIERRSAVLLRRDAIKVMTLKTLRGKELGEITTGRLEIELLQAINQIFDHGEIVAVKISNIRIEKAVKE